MPRFLVKLTTAVALLGAGALGGAALNASPPPPAPAAAPTARTPVEGRTIVKRRTVHVYRKPKRARPRTMPAAAAAAPPPPAATGVPAAPVPASHPVAPVAQRPLETRSSGAGASGEDRGEHEAEEEHEYGEGGDD